LFHLWADGGVYRGGVSCTPLRLSKLQLPFSAWAERKPDFQTSNKGNKMAIRIVGQRPAKQVKLPTPKPPEQADKQPFTEQLRALRDTNAHHSPTAGYAGLLPDDGSVFTHTKGGGLKHSDGRQADISGTMAAGHPERQQ
jgi:hypothetical protein